MLTKEIPQRNYILLFTKFEIPPLAFFLLQYICMCVGCNYNFYIYASI